MTGVKTNWRNDLTANFYPPFFFFSNNDKIKIIYMPVHSEQQRKRAHDSNDCFVSTVGWLLNLLRIFFPFFRI